VCNQVLAHLGRDGTKALLLLINTAPIYVFLQAYEKNRTNRKKVQQFTAKKPSQAPLRQKRSPALINAGL
jgi:hypothetical protein